MDEFADFFMSEMEEDGIVDMDEVREEMKQVPLPDMCFGAVDNGCFNDFQASLDDGDYGGSADTFTTDECKAETSHQSSAKPRSSARNAVAETVSSKKSGPPPDFSMWTVEDDLLLKNAIEAGAALEALARGAMRFSRRYTVKELQERWRALLYDSAISSKASVRMVEAETAFLESMRLMFPNKQKFQDFVQKRRKKSVRVTYYKKNSASAAAGPALDAGSYLQGAAAGNDEAFSEMVNLLAADPSNSVPSSKLEEAAKQHTEAETQEAENDTPMQTKDPTSISKVPPTSDVAATSKEPSISPDNGHQSQHAMEKDNVSKMQTFNGTEVYVLSSDEDDDLSPASKRPRLASSGVVEQMVCTLNTQETDVPAFDDSLLSSPSSHDEDRGEYGEQSVDAFFQPREQRRDMSPQAHGRQADSKEERQLSLPSDNLCFKISLGKRGMTFDQGKTRIGKDAVTSFQALNDAPLRLATSTLAAPLSPIELQRNVIPALEPLASAALIDTEPNESQEQQTSENIESEDEIARFSDVEAMILDMDLDPGDDDVSARAESKRLYRQNRRALLRLEQAANASMQRSLNARGAIAILYGHKLKYFMIKPEITIGRATQDNLVDLDLVQEGTANKVSRKQGSIKLMDDGMFCLKNTGRKVHVNNVAIDTGQQIVLSSNCLIEVGGMSFIFELNRKLVSQKVREMLQAGSS